MYTVQYIWLIRRARSIDIFADEDLFSRLYSSLGFSPPINAHADE